MKEKKLSKNKRVKPVKKTPTQFTVDLDVKGLVMFVVLGLMTALVIFYLGVIFGKASRDPGAIVASNMNQTAPKPVTEETITSRDLEIYNIRNGEEKIDSLKSESENAIAEAERLISSLNTQKPETPQPTSTKPEANVPSREAPQKQWPEQAASKKDRGEFYTVQVFATKDKDKADRIVRLLRKKGFDAYLAEATLEGRKIFRVRVGKRSKSEITKLNEQLKSVIGGMGMKSRIIQVN